jgi:hypothetical protein
MDFVSIYKSLYRRNFVPSEESLERIKNARQNAEGGEGVFLYSLSLIKGKIPSERIDGKIIVDNHSFKFVIEYPVRGKEKVVLWRRSD